MDPICDMWDSRTWELRAGSCNGAFHICPLSRESYTVTFDLVESSSWWWLAGRRAAAAVHLNSKQEGTCYIMCTPFSYAWGLFCFRVQLLIIVIAFLVSLLLGLCSSTVCVWEPGTTQSRQFKCSCVSRVWGMSWLVNFNVYFVHTNQTYMISRGFNIYTVCGFLWWKCIDCWETYK